MLFQFDRALFRQKWKGLALLLPTEKKVKLFCRKIIKFVNHFFDCLTRIQPTQRLASLFIIIFFCLKN